MFATKATVILLLLVLVVVTSAIVCIHARSSAIVLGKALVIAYGPQLDRLREKAQVYERYKGRSGFIGESGRHVDSSEDIFGGGLFARREILDVSIGMDGVKQGLHIPGVHVLKVRSWFVTDWPGERLSVRGAQALIDFGGGPVWVRVAVMEGRVKTTAGGMAEYTLIVRCESPQSEKQRGRE